MDFCIFLSKYSGILSQFRASFSYLQTPCQNDYCLARIVPTSGKNLATSPNAVLYNHSQLQLTPKTN